MSGPGDGEQEPPGKTVPVQVPEAPGGSDRLCLIISDDDNLTTQALPEAGVVTIGRATSCDICIDRPWISRQHAKLHIGPVLRLEDLGSSNGTSLRGTRLEANQTADLVQGDVIELGLSTLFVQRLSTAPRRRRIWPHASFEGLLEGECARAERGGLTFAILRVHASAEASASTEEALAHVLRSADVAGMFAPGEYEVLLMEASAVQADEVAQAIKKELEARRIPARLGVALYPQHGRTPDSLIGNAASSIVSDESSRIGDAAYVVKDPAMKRLYQLLERVAAGAINVLLLGETGVGKEVVAEALHRMSPRGSRPFLRLHCAALSESILESELFGHERGAFTGAVSTKPGLLATAEGGTVFLDEVGELPLSIQVKLLRVIEEHQVRRVGGLKAQAIDVRFVSATNRDLETDVAAGRFRQDLFFRLNGVTLVIPPLRERPSEIADLAQAFVSRASAAMQRGAPPILADEALFQVLRYSWPGNIRELRNVMERAFLLCNGDRITLEHLPTEKMGSATYPAPAAPAPEQRAALVEAAGSTPLREGATEPLQPPRRALEDERKRLLDALEACAGNQTRAARMLGISRGTLVVWLDKHDLPRPRRKP